MCVAITMMPGSKLTLDEVIKMANSNGDGVGVAWARRGVVQWYKTTKVDPEYIQRMVAYWAAYPRLVHFRLSTAGGVRPDLCHPFEIGPKANCRPIGEAGKVMIHNGHFSRWTDLMTLLEKEKLLPDEGPWSDTRLIALLAHEDPEWLEMLGGKVATMDGDGQLTHFGDWKDLREGIRVSNQIWDNNLSYKRGGYSGYRNWQGWDWSEEEFDAFILDKKVKQMEAEEAAQKAMEDKAAKHSEPTKLITHENFRGRKKGQGQGKGHPQGGPISGDSKEGGTSEQKAATDGISSSGDSDGESCQVKEHGVSEHGEDGTSAYVPLSPGNHYHGTGANYLNPSSGLRSHSSPTRLYDRKPFKSRTNGRIYQIGENGGVVDVTAEYSEEEKSKIESP